MTDIEALNHACTRACVFSELLVDCSSDLKIGENNSVLLDQIVVLAETLRDTVYLIHDFGDKIEREDS